jgi:hypothetical protein
MDELDPVFKEFLKSLNREKLRYLLIGGWAVNCYGYHRFTNDLGVWIAVDADNAENMGQVWQRFACFSADEVPSAMLLRLVNHPLLLVFQP